MYKKNIHCFISVIIFQISHVLEATYIKHVKEVGFLKLLNKKGSLSDLEEYLGFLLLISCKNSEDKLVTEINNFLSNYESVIWRNWKERNRIEQVDHKNMVHNIIHYRDGNDLTCIYYINKNNRLLNGLELLYNEKYAHGNRSEALKCIRMNAGIFLLDSWLLDTYKLVDPSNGFGKKFDAFLAVALQIILSLIFFASDLITDISLCVQYWFMAYNTGNSYCEYNPGIRPSCPRLNIKELYIPAFWIMITTLVISVSTYIWLAVKAKPPSKRIWDCSFFWKPLWPLFYLFEEFKLRSDPSKKLDDSLKEREYSWKLLKMVENGIENYIQFLLQLFLLAPFIGFEWTSPLQELLLIDLSNLSGIFNPNESLCGRNGGNSAMDKLFLSVLSLTYGVATNQTTRRGQSLKQTLKNLVLWLSYFLLCIVRIMSIFSLLALNNPVGPIVTFVTIHFLFVFQILVLTKEFIPNKQSKT